MPHKVLVLERNPDLRQLVHDILERMSQSFLVESRETAKDSMPMERSDFALIILDVSSPSGEESFPVTVTSSMFSFGVEGSVQYILLAYPEADTSIARGRSDIHVLRKPFGLSDFKSVLRRALPSQVADDMPSQPIVRAFATGINRCPPSGSNLETSAEIRAGSSSPGSNFPAESVRNPGRKEFHTQLARIASSHGTVLLFGETGSGKDVIARRLHDLSPRAKGPFVPVNCASLSSTLVESELFGCVKGAFTGALDRPGLVGIAGGGTLFLDEIAELPFDLQPKLNRFLGNGEYRPVGSDKTYRADVRIIAATNADLEALVEKRKFREDLYSRLDVLTLHVPPLRERSEDIPSLIETFARDIARRDGRPVPTFTPRAIEMLMHLPWKRNVRELQAAIDRIVVLSTAPVIDAADLPLKYRHSDNCDSDPRTGSGGPRKAPITKDELLRALGLANGRAKAASRILGCDRRHVYILERKFGIQRNPRNPGKT